MRTLLIISILSLGFQLSAQNTECPCCNETHQQFDFWVGEWNVFDITNSLVGTNRIVKLEDACILQENWKSTKGGTGSSYNYYNKTDSSWNQVWIDNSGGVLELKGNLTQGKMVLKSQIQVSKKGKKYYNQISWTPNSDGSVTQLWQLFTENGSLIQTSFKGVYREKTN